MTFLHTVCTVPSAPRLLSVTRILFDGFELNWLPPRELNGRPVYEIEYGTDDTNFTTVDTGSRDTYYNLTGLQHNTTYYIRVVAVNYMTFGGVPLRGNKSETLTMFLASQPTPLPAPPPTDTPSPGTTGGITGMQVHEPKRLPLIHYTLHYKHTFLQALLSAGIYACTTIFFLNMYSQHVPIIHFLRPFPHHHPSECCGWPPPVAYSPSCSGLCLLYVTEEEEEVAGEKQRETQLRLCNTASGIFQPSRRRGQRRICCDREGQLREEWPHADNE